MKSVFSSTSVLTITTLTVLMGSFLIYNELSNNSLDENGQRQGYWIITGNMVNSPEFSPSSIVDEGKYLDDKKVGIWKKYYPSGKVRSVITYENNKPIGPYTLYYENGVVEESGNWQRNKNTGEFHRNYSNGNPHQRFAFSDSGKRNGKQTYYHENGNVALLVDVVNGKETGVMQRFDTDGKLTEEKSFNNGSFMKGSTKTYGQSPVVKEYIPEPAEVEEKSDVVPSTKENKTDETNSAHHFKQNGHNILYDKNQNISQSGFFKDGKLWNGKWYKYNVNGILLRVDIYRNGKFIGHGVLESE